MALNMQADAGRAEPEFIGVSGVGNGKLPDAKAELSRLRAISLWQAVSAASAANPEQIALVAADDAGEVQRISYGRLLDRVRSLSAGLASTGVCRGDRVVLWMTNTIEWVVSAFAVMRIGATLVPVNTFLKPPEIKYFMEQSGARHLIMLDRFRKLHMPTLLEEICPGIGTQARPGSLFSRELPDLRNVILFARSGGALACANDLAALERPSEAMLALADQMERDVTGSDLAMVKFTSGSTAFPKGAMLQQGGMVANGILHSRRMNVSARDIYFSSMPFFHAGGSIFGMMTMLLNGGTLVFTETFNAELAADMIMQEKATMQVTMLANEIVQVALKKGYVFDTIRLAAWPDEASRKVMPNSTASFASYGLTESYGGAAFTCHHPADMENAKPTPLDGTECRIVDPETGLEVPPGVRGEAWLRGNIASGYWNKPVETAQAFDKEGWLHTEDLCSVDEQGRITYHGRLKLMLKIGGENVSIEDVERVVGGHEAVLACGVVGVPDRRKSEAVCVYIQLKDGHDLDAERLLSWLKPRLAHFKMPREVVFVSEFPHLGNGKIDRLTLAKWAKEQFSLD